MRVLPHNVTTERGKEMQTGLFKNDDICARKHRGSPTSIAANERASKHKVANTAKILNFAIKNMGRCYSKQVARALNIPLNSISGRFSELRKAGTLVDTGEVEEGCAVLKLVIK